MDSLFDAISKAAETLAMPKPDAETMHATGIAAIKDWTQLSMPHDADKLLDKVYKCAKKDGEYRLSLLEMGVPIAKCYKEKGNDSAAYSLAKWQFRNSLDATRARAESAAFLGKKIKSKKGQLSIDFNKPQPV